METVPKCKALFRARSLLSSVLAFSRSCHFLPCCVTFSPGHFCDLELLLSSRFHRLFWKSHTCTGGSLPYIWECLAPGHLVRSACGHSPILPCVFVSLSTSLLSPTLDGCDLSCGGSSGDHDIAVD
jgi:hypothetical protein